MLADDEAHVNNGGIPQTRILEYKRPNKGEIYIRRGQLTRGVVSGVTPKTGSAPRTNSQLSALSVEMAN